MVGYEGISALVSWSSMLNKLDDLFHHVCDSRPWSGRQGSADCLK
uniref:Uncharacterized protein n=1 Tax=Arundo donax TaxID=35708 RepID=A0A0A9KJ86_ARUDO